MGLYIRHLCSSPLLSPKVILPCVRSCSAARNFHATIPVTNTNLFQKNSENQSNIPGVTGIYSYDSRRFYMRKKTIKMPPTKPLHFDYSGDLSYNEIPLDISEPKLGFENIQELQEASDVVKKIFSLEYGDSQDLLRKRLTELTEWAKEHPADVRSLEFLIAMYTVQIRNQIKHCLEFRKDKRSKGILITRIQRRKRALKHLRKLDYDKFEWILNELKIKYVPGTKYNFPVSKRAARKRVAATKALGIRNKKIEDFRKKLEAERTTFDEIKTKELTEIEKELKTLGIERGETLSDTIEILKYGHVLEKKKRPPKKRREILLAMKFELYKNKYPPKWP